MEEATGRVVEIQGAVVDCEFPQGHLPEIYDAIAIGRESQDDLILEVQRHLGDQVVRTVAMDATDGLQRGVSARGTGAAISVPVGEATLGRVFNVLGQPIDGRGEVDTTLRPTLSIDLHPHSMSSLVGLRFSRPVLKSST